MPGVHRVAALLKRWLLGTHQGAVESDHLQGYLDEFAFRFNRRHSAFRGLLFRRLLEQTVQTGPMTYRSLVANPSPNSSPCPLSAHHLSPASLAVTSSVRRGEPQPGRDYRTQMDTPLVFEIGVSEEIGLVKCDRRTLRAVALAIAIRRNQSRAPLNRPRGGDRVAWGWAGQWAWSRVVSCWMGGL